MQKLHLCKASFSQMNDYGSRVARGWMRTIPGEKAPGKSLSILPELGDSAGIRAGLERRSSCAIPCMSGFFHGVSFLDQLKIFKGLRQELSMR